MVGKGGGAGAPPAPPLLSLRPCTETLWIFIERAKNIFFQMPRQEIFSSPAGAATGALFFLALTMHLKFVSD